MLEVFPRILLYTNIVIITRKNYNLPSKCTRKQIKKSLNKYELFLNETIIVIHMNRKSKNIIIMALKPDILWLHLHSWI